MNTYDTLTEAIEGLRKQGFIQDYNLKSDRLHCQPDNVELHPADFDIVEVYRFEGMTDPGDEMVLFAISSKDDAVKGIVVNAFGAYEDDAAAKMVTHLKKHL